EHAEISEIAHAARLDITLAEIVLAAGVHGHVGVHVLAMPIEEAEQAAPMVEVAMAHDQRVDLLRIDLQQVHVAVDRLGRPTEVQEERALLLATMRLEIKRQSPFAVQ